MDNVINNRPYFALMSILRNEEVVHAMEKKCQNFENYQCCHQLMHPINILAAEKTKSLS